MWSWINTGGGSSSVGGITIVPVLNVSADITLTAPAKFTIINVVVEQATAPTVATPFVSIGNNTPDFDNYVPSQEIIPSGAVLDKNTILIDRTPMVATTLTIHSGSWDGSYNFYFALIKYK
jgi:hypothetical protein